MATSTKIVSSISTTTQTSTKYVASTTVTVTSSIQVVPACVVFGSGVPEAIPAYMVVNLGASCFDASLVPTSQTDEDLAANHTPEDNVYVICVTYISIMPVVYITSTTALVTSTLPGSTSTFTTTSRVVLTSVVTATTSTTTTLTTTTQTTSTVTSESFIYNEIFTKITGANDASMEWPNPPCDPDQMANFIGNDNPVPISGISGQTIPANWTGDTLHDCCMGASTNGNVAGWVFDAVREKGDRCFFLQDDNCNENNPSRFTITLGSRGVVVGNGRSGIATGTTVESDDSKKSEL